MHLLLERITVIPTYVERGAPRWRCSRPIEQHAVGVWTWRRINGAWIEGLFLCVSKDSSFDTQRVRLVVEGWAGMPATITLYDVLGEVNEAEDLADRLAQTEMLMGALEYMRYQGERG